MSVDFLFLARSAGTYPVLGVLGDAMPDEFLFEEACRCSSGRMGEAVEEVENVTSEGGRYPWTWAASTDVAEECFVGVVQRDVLPFESGDSCPAGGVFWISLLFLGELAVVKAYVYGADGGSGQGVRHWAVLAW